MNSRWFVDPRTPDCQHPATAEEPIEFSDGSIVSADYCTECRAVCLPAEPPRPEISIVYSAPKELAPPPLPKAPPVPARPTKADIKNVIEQLKQLLQPNPNPSPDK